MKMRLCSLMLIVMLAVPTMAGCQVGAAKSADNTNKKSAATTVATVSGNYTTPVLTLEEAQSIALEHAGFTADQVTALHTEYGIEHGIPEYDVEFHHGTWEYDYEIHADTGEILSFSKDD